MTAAEVGDFGGQETAVGGVAGGDGVGMEDSEALTAIGGLALLEFGLLQPEGVGGCPDGADVEGGGVVGGTHGLEDGFEVVGVLVLELVDDEEPVGGFAAGGGLGMGAEEYDLGATEPAGSGRCGAVGAAEAEDAAIPQSG